MVKDLDCLSYEEELRELGLLTLRKRRLGEEEILSMCISIRAGEVGGSKGDIFHTVCMVKRGNGSPRKAVGSAPLKMLKILLDKVLSNVLSLTLL